MEFLRLLIVIAFYGLVGGTAALTLAIVVRQFVLSFAITRQRSVAARAEAHSAEPVEDPSGVDLPTVAIIVPAHNEEKVIAGSLEALVRTNYPHDRLQIIVIDDRSTDRTRQIIDAYAARYPIVTPVHRPIDAVPGKSAALSEATAGCAADVFVFFDADYLPGPVLVRQLVAPFRDPRVGATMGRVVPVNSNANLLTRLIDLERRAGYVVDQQMRQHWRLLPQFGGTTGAVSSKALRDIGGWKEGHLTEDTWVTYALFLRGYDVVYLNEAACYEETPETWVARYKQVRRWSYGHNDCMFAFLGRTLTADRQPLVRRLDAAVVLLFYVYPVLACISLPFSLLAIASMPVSIGWSFAALIPLFFGFGNLAPFFQIAIAARQDRQEEILRYLPFIFLSSLITMFAAADGFARLFYDRARRRSGTWDKTARFRRATGQHRIGTAQPPLVLVPEHETAEHFSRSMSR